MSVHCRVYVSSSTEPMSVSKELNEIGHHATLEIDDSATIVVRTIAQAKRLSCAAQRVVELMEKRNGL